MFGRVLNTPSAYDAEAYELFVQILRVNCVVFLQIIVEYGTSYRANSSNRKISDLNNSIITISFSFCNDINYWVNKFPDI